MNSAALYRSLYLCRAAEKAIIEHYPANQMRTPMHMSMGQEFVSVGVCAALRGKADVFASYRSHTAFLAQTGDTDRFFAELFGRASGTGEGKGGSMHLSAPDQGHMLSSGVVATQIPVAVGAAFANRQLKTGRTAVAFFGDGAMDAGVFWESINVAALYKLPMLFVCEDNGYAVDTPREKRQALRSLPGALLQFGVDTFGDISGDVESVFDLTRRALARQAPVFMHIKCCRYLEHVGIGEDWHWGYRTRESVERNWKSRDALAVQRARLNESEATFIETEVDRKIRTSIERALAAPAPAVNRLHAGVFHEAA